MNRRPFRRRSHTEVLSLLRRLSPTADSSHIGLYTLARHYTAMIQCSNLGCLFNLGYMSYAEYYSDRLRAYRNSPPQFKKAKNEFVKTMQNYGTVNEKFARENYLKAVELNLLGDNNTIILDSVKTGGMYHHKDYEWIAGSPDFTIETSSGETILGEIKCRWQQRNHERLKNTQIKEGWLLQIMGMAAILRSIGKDLQKIHFVHHTDHDMVVQEVLWKDLEEIWTGTVLPKCKGFIEDIQKDLLPNSSQYPSKYETLLLQSKLKTVPKKVIFQRFLYDNPSSQS